MLDPRREGDAVLRVLDKESMSEKFHKPSLDVGGLRRRRPTNSAATSKNSPVRCWLSGTDGSGKTTTLYAAVSEIKTDEDKIITIEDPVRIPDSRASRRDSGQHEKKGLTFKLADWRSILRHDPDKIMVGEIRDTETAQIAIQSALTGHLVFTTVHANNVVDVIGRFLNMGVGTVALQLCSRFELHSGATAGAT